LILNKTVQHSRVSNFQGVPFDGPRPNAASTNTISPWYISVTFLSQAGELQQGLGHALHAFSIQYAVNLAALGEADSANVAHLPDRPSPVFYRSAHIFSIVMR
jgi:hypothetical protein